MLRQSLKLPKVCSENIMKNTFGNLKSTVKNVKFNFSDKSIMIDCICTSFLCSEIENQNFKIVAENFPNLKNLT